MGYSQKKKRKTGVTVPRIGEDDRKQGLSYTADCSVKKEMNLATSKEVEGICPLAYQFHGYILETQEIMFIVAS